MSVIANVQCLIRGLWRDLLAPQKIRRTGTRSLDLYVQSTSKKIMQYSIISYATSPPASLRSTRNLIPLRSQERDMLETILVVADRLLLSDLKNLVLDFLQRTCEGQQYHLPRFQPNHASSLRSRRTLLFLL